MKKIVELLIGTEEFSSEELGVDVVSLVETPAIGYKWMAFNAETFEDVVAKAQEFVLPKAGESKDEFISRCIPIVQAEGYEEDQAVAICYSYALDSSEKKLKEIESEKIQAAVLEMAEKLGESHDTKTTIYLNAEDFAEDNTTVGGVARAIGALDILGKRAADDELKEVYKYQGPPAQRNFCRALMRTSETKVYTRDEIRQMNSLNPGFGEGGSGTYDVFRFAGGPNCRHRFVQYNMFKGDDGRTLLIKTGEEGTPPAQTNRGGYVSEESRMKSLRGWWAKLGGARFSKMEFQTIDEEQKIVVAPAMIPNSLIARKDEAGNEYYVYFSKDTIRDISEKFFKNNYTNNTDINHDGDVTQHNTLLESWIKDDEEFDKSNKYGFESTPVGTWFLSYKINDDETWNKIKAGQLQGYSISGNFLEMAKN